MNLGGQVYCGCCIVGQGEQEMGEVEEGEDFDDV